MAAPISQDGGKWWEEKWRGDCFRGGRTYKQENFSEENLINCLAQLHYLKGELPLSIESSILKPTICLSFVAHLVISCKLLHTGHRTLLLSHFMTWSNLLFKIIYTLSLDKMKVRLYRKMLHTTNAASITLFSYLVEISSNELDSCLKWKKH